MINLKWHCLKMLFRQSSVIFECKCSQATYSIPASRLSTWSNYSGNLAKLKKSFTNNLIYYSTNRKKYKPPKIQPPEYEANLPIFQYASETSKAKGRVYIWGNAMYGALGIREHFISKTPRQKQSRPARFPLADHHHVTNIACGYGFTVCAVKEKNKSWAVYGTGLNSNSQIGYYESKRNSALRLLIVSMRLNIPSDPSTIIKQVACGRAHTFILTEKKIFSLGNNAYGQCGRPIIEDEDYSKNPRVHTLNFEEEVEEIICGQDNTIFRTNKGEIYSIGWGADGQLGTGSYNNVWNPTKVGGDIAGEKITKISCSADCVLAVSEKGELFGWGNNEYGQVYPNSDIQQLSVPRHIPTTNCGKIIEAAAAGTMCAILNNEGQVFVWGYGILGMGPEVQHKTTFSALPMPLFGRNEFNTTTTVVAVRSGITHFAAITNDGNLYMWGQNKYGCLGFAAKQDQYFPMRVAVPAKVLDVSCGVDHTAAICKTFS